jgi:hypothetical protein
MALEFDIEKIIGQDTSSKFAPNYENNIRNKMLGYNIVFKFPNNNNPEENSVSFPAYTSKVDDSYNTNFNSEKVYGRMDPIPVYQGTSRTISFDLSIPSNGLAHSQEIAKKLNILVKNTYPIYQKYSDTTNIIASPPLVAVFFSNLIYDSKDKTYLLGYFERGLSISHDLTKGVFARGNGFEVYPKLYSLNFSLTVLHSFLPGYVKSANGNEPVTNPINILQAVR